MSKTYELSTGMELLDKPDRLDGLALQIRVASCEAMRHANEATEGALIAGKLLIEAKAQIGHGDWENWVTANCGVALRTAQAYMRLSKSVQQLDTPNTQRVALLPLREALKAIATDPTAPPKRPSIRTHTRNERERVEAVLGKAEAALKSTKRLIGFDQTVKGKDVDALRTKLNAVLAELDSLEAEAKAVQL